MQVTHARVAGRYNNFFEEQKYSFAWSSICTEIGIYMPHLGSNVAQQWRRVCTHKICAIWFALVGRPFFFVSNYCGMIFSESCEIQPNMNTLLLPLRHFWIVWEFLLLSRTYFFFFLFVIFQSVHLQNLSTLKRSNTHTRGLGTGLIISKCSCLREHKVFSNVLCFKRLRECVVWAWE